MPNLMEYRIKITSSTDPAKWVVGERTLGFRTTINLEITTARFHYYPAYESRCG